jgi:hypothetical protein
MKTTPFVSLHKLKRNMSVEVLSALVIAVLTSLILGKAITGLSISGITALAVWALFKHVFYLLRLFHVSKIMKHVPADEQLTFVHPQTRMSFLVETLLNIMASIPTLASTYWNVTTRNQKSYYPSPYLTTKTVS